MNYLLVPNMHAFDRSNYMKALSSFALWGR